MTKRATNLDGHRGGKSTKAIPKPHMMSLADLDNRTNAAKAARALIEAIESDLGGADSLSAGQRTLAARAGVMTAFIEDMETRWIMGGELDVAAYSSLSNVLSRTLRILGLQRQSKDITGDLQSYITARTAGDNPEQPPRTPRPPKPSAMHHPKRKRTDGVQRLGAPRRTDVAPAVPERIGEPATGNAAPSQAPLITPTKLPPPPY
jgi:hypothetical protein